MDGAVRGRFDSSRMGVLPAVGAAAPAVFLGFIAAAVVLWPAAYAVVQVMRGVAAHGEPVGWAAPLVSFGRTLLWAGLIGVLSTAAAWPAAWASRRMRARWFALLLVPMLMPSYLAYSGWGLLRAPGTPIGDWLLSGPNWRPILAGRVLAVGGLVLWAWPLAAVVLAIRLRRIDPALLDALRLDARSAWRRALVVVSISRGALAAAVGAVVLVMVGSAVPLHLAQIQTHAIVLWRLMDESGPGEHWRVWAGAWPIAAVSLGVAVFVGRALASTDAGQDAGEEGPRCEVGRHRWWPRWSGALAGAVWAASVLAPVALFIHSLPAAASLLRFWRFADEAIVTSAAVAAGVGCVGVIVACAAWLAFAERVSGRAAAVCAGALVVAGLLPGVLVGSMMAAAWNAWGPSRAMADTAFVLVVGHTARFGFLAVLGGWWLARSEPSGLRDLMRLDGVGFGRGWLAARLPPGAGPLAGIGLGMAALSFHEIESAIVLQPPGTESFARLMLENLHFARMEALSAGALYAIGGGLGLALGAAWLLGKAHRLRRP